VRFPPQDQSPSQATVGIRPAGVGTAVVTLGPLPGNPNPADGNQLVYNVTEADPN
jgi:hypothetical protein